MEDELIVAKDQAGRLEREGFEVVVASSGREAVEIALREQVDLVLMDIRLGGGLDGIEAAEEILRKKELPVVFLTAYADPRTLAEVSRVTPYGYVLKNSGIHLLLQSIRMALDLFSSRQEIREREERLRSLIDASPEIILLIDQRGNLLEANRHALEFFGLRESPWRGSATSELEPRLIPHLVGPFRELTRDGREGEFRRWDASLTDAAGKERVFDVIQATWNAGDGEQGLIVIGRDVSERSRVTENLREKTRQLQRLSRHIQETREEQNRYVAREIHDELGQALTSMDILLTLAQEERESEKLSKTLGEIRDVLQSTSKTVRNLVRELRPSVLDHLGLVEALRTELAEFEERSGVPCDFVNTLPGVPEIGDTCALAVYRIVQEVLELTEPSRLPQMPYYMEGIVNVRDAVLPVVDMRRRFGLEEVERTVDSAIVVMELSGGEEEHATTVGCLVDAVDAVVELDPSQVEAPPEIGTSVDSDFLRGIAKVEERFVMILDPDALFNRREIERVGQKNAAPVGG